MTQETLAEVTPDCPHADTIDRLAERLVAETDREGHYKWQTREMFLDAFDRHAMPQQGRDEA